MNIGVGCKIIQYEEMTKGKFDDEFFNGKPRGFEPREQKAGDGTPGYHVVYPNPEGVPYHSWSPKNIFDDCYRQIADYETCMIIDSFLGDPVIKSKENNVSLGAGECLPDHNQTE